MPESELRNGVVDGPPGLPVTRHEEDARPVAGADEDVLGPVRAVEEIPCTERSLLTLDQQEALAVEDEEALLCLLPVVEPVGLSGLENASLTPRSANSASGDSNTQLAPKTSCVSHVASRALTTNQPSVAGRQSGPVVRETRFVDHGPSLAVTDTEDSLWQRPRMRRLPGIFAIEIRAPGFRSAREK